MAIDLSSAFRTIGGMTPLKTGGQVETPDQIGSESETPMCDANA